MLLAAAACCCAARADDTDATTDWAGLVVIGTTPLLGADLDRDRVPSAAHVISQKEIDRTGIPSLTGAVLENVPSASVNDTEGNAFQPDILFRGFTASPVAGTPQGLAVFVNGARFNDAFGDTVNWDLIPPSAIDSVTLQASNPLFGLNALGGSINIRLKTGFSTPGSNLTLYGGSYGRRSAILEFGRQQGAFAIYAVGDLTREEGFRQTSTSTLYRFYTDLGWRSADIEVHLGLNAAHDILGNPGATPQQALDADISNIFTAPNEVSNSYLGSNLRATGKLTDTLSLQGVAYFQQLNQVVPNGITSEVAPCDDGTGLLCNDDGGTVTTYNRKPVTDFLYGAPYSGLSIQQLTSRAYGASVQLSNVASFGALANTLLAGFSIDGSDSLFAGVSELGGFDPYTRQFLGPGVVQDQPDEGVNPVRVTSDTQCYGVFVSDVLKLAEPLDLSISGRFNEAEIALEDERGGPVNGRHTYSRFNPSAGLTYRVASLLQLYGSYSQTNRAPTPQELSCASAAAPCSLLNFFVGDPDLKQVVAHTWEAGVRGHTDRGEQRQLSWNVDAYRTLATNDIIYETSLDNPNLAFYTNAGRTLRQGIESSVRIDHGPLRLSVGYSFTSATFRSSLLLNTPDNPAADANEREEVASGDKLPGISRHRATFVLDYSLSARWSVGASVLAQSSFYRFGDEANLTAPVGGRTVVDLNAAFRPNQQLTLFAVLDNAFDKRYYTYGAFGPVGDVPWPAIPGGVADPRTASPGAPLSAYGGIRLCF